MHLWDLFWDIRSGLKTEDPLNSVEFKSYLELYEVDLERWEKILIKNMDSYFMSHMSKKHKENQPNKRK